MTIGFNYGAGREPAATGRQAGILVIGYGNPLRSDDGIGRCVARELQIRPHDTRIEVIECHELAPEIADKFRSAKLVIFVDAETGGISGGVSHDRLDWVGAKESKGSLSHGRTPQAVVALAADLYGVAPEVHLFTICGSAFSYGIGFSPAVATALPIVVSEIEDLIRTAESRNPTG